MSLHTLEERENMKNYHIANIPGDGVGKEVAREAVKILRAAADKFGFGISFDEYDWSCDYYLKHGEMGPENVLDLLKDTDAIFLGCIGAHLEIGIPGCLAQSFQSKRLKAKQNPEPMHLLPDIGLIGIQRGFQKRNSLFAKFVSQTVHRQESARQPGMAQIFQQLVDAPGYGILRAIGPR